MRRLAVLALAATAVLALLAVSASAHSSVRVRGTVALKDPASRVVTVRTARLAVGLHVPGSLDAIRVGQRVELRGTTLRSHGNGSRVLARNVTIASSAPLSAPKPPDRDDDVDDDEVEITGRIASLSPLTVASARRSVTCAVPSGVSLAGFAVGDLVEITCDRGNGAWVLRKVHHEDDDDDRRRDDDDDRSGPGGGDDDDDNSGPGGDDDD